MDLTYTHQVVQETLRLYPPAWWILRMANEDDEMDGFYIPANTMVAPMPYVIHRHPEVWQKPDQFDPERFVPERFLNQHKLAWLPFGSGQRQCIGKDLTMMESKLILIRMMQRYHITAVPNFVPQEHAAMTFRSKNGILLHLAKRA
jgi:cytochrome P450